MPEINEAFANKVSFEEIDALTSSNDLAALKALLLIKERSIRNKISMAKKTKALTNEAADPDWLLRTEKAKAHVGLLIKKVEAREIIVLRTEGKPLEYYFYIVAREKLTKIVYNGMIEQAKELKRKVEETDNGTVNIKRLLNE